MNKNHFLERHRSGPMIRMPNAWDAGSAKTMQAAGAEAIGTTSAGIVYTLGLPDYEGQLDIEACLAASAAIVDAVDIPVSIDSEDGWGDTPDDVAAAFKRMTAMGAAGASIEDHPRRPGNDLLSTGETADRIAAARAAIDAAATPFVLTARAECFLVGHPDPLAESIRRLKIYAEAGADCLYAPGLRKTDDIRRVLDEVGAPVNILVGIKGLEPTIDELETMGVARISTGGSVMCATLGLARDATQALNAGRTDYLAGAISHNDLTQIFNK